MLSNVKCNRHNHDVKPLIDKAHSVGALFLLDKAQGASHIKTSVKELDVELLCVLHAHKMLGPTGIGILYGKEHILEKHASWMGGGDMISEVTKDWTTYADLPARLEAGTLIYRRRNCICSRN